MGSAHTCTLFVKSVAKTFVFCFFVFFIYLCVNQTAIKAQPRTLRVLKCSAFWLTLTAYLFCYRFALLFRFLLLLRFSICGLRPHLHAFCKKRGKNFCVLFLCVLYLSLRKSDGNQSPTTNATRSKMLRILVNFDCLSFLLSLRSAFSFFASASLFYLWALPTPVRFLKKAKPKTFVFCIAVFYIFLLLSAEYHSQYRYCHD